MVTEEIRIVCFECGLNFSVTTDNPKVIMMFAEQGCLSPRCKAVHALMVQESALTGNGDGDE
jgi:hypothetical protein